MKTRFLPLLVLILCFCFQPILTSKASIDENPEAVKALAKCLKSTGAVMYGTKNCGHCNAQKQMFGPYFKEIRFVDCRANSAAGKECNQAKVGKFPQWNFENGRTIVREADLDRIADVSGCQAYVAQALGSEYSQASSQGNSASISSSSVTNASNSYSESTSSATSSSSVYGSPEQLAQCLKTKGVKFYGSPKCSHCNKQKDMFEGAFEKYLSGNFHNCKGSAKEQAECYSQSTFPFPTWIEPSTGKKLPGPEKSLTQIAKAFKCTLDDTGASTTITAPVSNVSSPSSTKDSDVYVPTAGFPSKSENVDSTSLQNNQISSVASETLMAATSTGAVSSERYLLEQRQNKLGTCLANKNIILYGITDSSKGKPVQFKATQDQLLELGSAAKNIKVIDCSAGQAECNGILVYPTWILENKNELAGVYELTNLAQIIGCSLD